jgi:hypothetical protein
MQAASPGFSGAEVLTRVAALGLNSANSHDSAEKSNQVWLLDGIPFENAQRAARCGSSLRFGYISLQENLEPICNTS